MNAASLCALWVLLCSPPRFGEEFHEISSETGPIYWKGLSHEDASWVSRELPKAMLLARQRLGVVWVRSVDTVILPSRLEMRRFLEREGLGANSSSFWQPLGVTVPSRGLVVIRWDHMAPSESLTETLLHEAAHLVMHPSNSSGLPRWLDEGLAQWVSGRRLSPDDIAYLVLLARIGALYPFVALEARFPAGHELSSIAYKESLLFIQYFVSIRGESGIPELLDAFHRLPSEQAFKGLFSGGSAQVEKEFHAWILGQATWGAALASIVNLWSVSGVLALVAVLRHQLRRRRRLEAMETDDPGQGTSAEPPASPSNPST